MGEQDQEQELLGSLLLQQSYPSFKQNIEEQDKEQELLGSLLLQQSYPSFKQNMEEQDKEQELLGSLLLLQSYPSFMQRKWESRIRNRNFWARCSCYRVIRHSCRGSGRAGSGTGTSGLTVPATELSFIHAEEVGE